MTKGKAALIQKGSKVLTSLQSEEEFQKLLKVENWAITQTLESNIIFVDLDQNDHDKNLDQFFNRRRDKYVNHSEHVRSKHGFLKVVDADHNWCNEFAKKYHIKSGLEIYSKGHWGIFAGTYYNSKNIDDPKRETTWFAVDDIHSEPIMEVTKIQLGQVFGVVALTDSTSASPDLHVDEIIKDNFVVNEGEDRERFIIKYMVSRIIKNPEFLDDRIILMRIANNFNENHCNPPISNERLEKSIKQSINYALPTIKNRQMDSMEKSVVFDTNDEHKVIVNTAIKSMNKLTKAKEEINKDSLLSLITKSLEDENSMGDYQEGGVKHDQLLQLVSLFIENANDEIEFLQSYLESKPYNRFAHVQYNDQSEQYVTWYWTSKKWSDNTGNYILKSLYNLKGDEIKPNFRTATTISNNLSGSPKTLQVDLTNEKYQHELMTYVPNRWGKYFDLTDGKVKDVDPSRMFYFNPHVNLEFDVDASKPELFLKFLENKFPDEEDRLIFIDALASHFIHTSKLGAKPKATICSGVTNAGKSLLIEIMKKIVASEVTCNLSMKSLGDKWALSLAANCNSNFSEEEDAEEPKDSARSKDLITKESGQYEQKNAKSQKHAIRFPRHLLMCNKVPPIAKDDEDESIYQRYQYLIVHFDKENEDVKNDRKMILDDQEELQKIQMFLLRRASEIFNGSNIHMQTIEQAKSSHIELTQGSMRSFIEKHCIVDGISNEIGTSYNWLLYQYNAVMPSKLSTQTFTVQMEVEGFEKKTRTWVYRTLGEPNVFTEIRDMSNEDTKTQQTVIFGLKPKIISKSARPPSGNNKKTSGLVNKDTT